MKNKLINLPFESEKLKSTKHMNKLENYFNDEQRTKQESNI